MRKLLCCLIPRWGLSLAGLGCIVVAVGAWHLGLDNNPVMGPRRMLLLALGTATLLGVHYRKVGALLRRVRPPPSLRPRADTPRRDPTTAKADATGIHHSTRWIWPTLSLTLPAVLALHLWLVTAGEWTRPLPQTTFYYDMLGEALASGQTSLKVTPDPRLAQLVNPYDPVERAVIPRCRPGTVWRDCLLWDASYFDGKYYLYWGPAPAAVLAVFKRIGFGRLGDLTLAWIGAAALFSLLAYCLVNLWHRYFSQLPRGLLIPPLMLAGLAYPLPWILDAPRIYEAAIVIGAAFLMAGFALTLPVLASGDARPGRLALVGVVWGLSFGSRAVLGLPIAVLVAAIAWRLFRPTPIDSRPRSLWRPLVALALPLAAAIALIGLYNFARFSDPLEFGWRYALGPPTVQSAGTGASFDWGNLPVNLYNYLFAPASIVGRFPFLEPVPATRALGPIQIPHPTLSYGEYVTGLLLSSPFVIFGVYLVGWLICGSADCTHPQGEPSAVPPGRSGLPRIGWALSLASVAAFLPMLFLYAVTARYLLDVVPFVTMVASLGAWTAYRNGQQTRFTRFAIASAIVVAAAASGVVSILLALNNLST